MPSVPLTFFFIALVILLGFVTQRVFQVTRFPDIPILLSIGLLIGPLNRAALDAGFGSTFLVENISISVLKDFAPFVSTLALVVILFDSGLKLDFAHFSRSMRPAFVHTLPTFTLTVLTLTFVAHSVLGMPPVPSVVLAVALSNVGQTVSAAVIREIDVDPEVRSIYFIEMAIYDLISIPILVAFLEYAQEAGSAAGAGMIAPSLARVISISVLLGLLSGFVWIRVLLRLQNYPYSYMVTLASLLVVYSLNSFLGGSGPVSVLIFGLVIGNRESLLKTFRIKGKAVVEGERVHSFHDEITFFVRAFYFIFLGLTFSTGIRGAWRVSSQYFPFSNYSNTATLFLAGVALMFIAIVICRYVVVRFVSSQGMPHRMSLFPVYGRGLGTAVLATFPFTIEAYQPGTAYYALFNPWESLFVNAALLIILLTVMGTSVTVWAQERRHMAAAAHRSDSRSAVKE